MGSQVGHQLAIEEPRGEPERAADTWLDFAALREHGTQPPGVVRSYPNHMKAPAAQFIMDVAIPTER